MLRGRRMLPTVPASDLTRARAWCADKLGTPSARRPGSGTASNVLTVTQIDYEH
jgi:hypothetical protein